MTDPTDVLVERVRRGYITKPSGPAFNDGLVALDLLAARVRDRDGEGPVPTEAGGPGKEQVYWLRCKLNASIRHLRDIEDYFRMQGGTDDSRNMALADRARDIYEQITEDLFEGRIGVPTLAARVRELEGALREITNLFHAEPETYRAIARAALPEKGSES